ncbi:SGNH hydrolase domain-containing protein [Kitasatospora sp. NBC_01287]|uniref:acyltransferase family protein n=1 Tax=Kitasatospora sp. NBC_01287 TaxID=2903573 RepID=UPI00225725F4|nr:acyltransferase family protein [Kitasatospora sp. NBC_01287]MCX4744555.1 SGNH hydrolase domain-containing protein [Kitasatospora sp. NBC_01287]
MLNQPDDLNELTTLKTLTKPHEPTRTGAPSEPGGLGRPGRPNGPVLPGRPHAPGAPGGPGEGTTGFRPDIEGLRAVALLAVLGFHAGVPHLAGGFVGVDVFFVISGYLITGQLLREALGTGRIRLAEFFSRRARRLLPSAALVLAVVALASVWLTAPLRRTDLEYDVLASALSVANWRFVAQQTDYLAAGRDPSPLLHFWSLAVEEQFYLVWAPLLALLVYLTIRHSRRHARAAVIAVTASVTAVSLLLALYWTHREVSLAYLGSPSRVWQFGVGALIALLPWHRLPGPRGLRALVGWAGAAAIAWSVIVYTASTPYPGYAALLPTLGAGALILAGIPGRGQAPQAGPVGPGRLLALAAPRAVGRLSYNLYLWHWPVLVLAEARFGQLGWPVRLALTAAAALPALATMRWVERPLRRNPVVTELPRRGLSLGLSAVIIPVVLALVVGTGTLRVLGSGGPIDLAGLPPGAATGPSLLQPATGPTGHTIVPSAAQARKDFPPDGACEVPPTATSSPPCLFGDTASSNRIVLLGDSHAGQWFSAMLAIAAERHWALEELVKQGCPLPQLTVTNPQLGRTYKECDSWRADSLARLQREPKPSLIVVASLNRYTADDTLLAQAWEQTLTPLRAIGVPIVYLTDPPIPGQDVPACVSGHTADPGACDFPRGQANWPDPLAEAIAAGREPGVRAISVNSVLCPGSGPNCPAVLQRILLYRDDAHLTNTAVVVLTPRVEQLLVDASLVPARDSGAGGPSGAGGASGTGGPSASAAAPAGWTQLLRDDFQGPAGAKPSSALWQYDTGTCYPGCPAAQWGTGEVESMTDAPGNVALDGRGALEITPTEQNGQWSSGRLETKGADFAAPAGGVLRIEASIQLPQVSGPAAAGYWPAFWTLGAGLRNGFTGWPGIGELDVMESVNGRGSVFGTMHCGTAQGGPCQEPQGLGSGEQPCPACQGGFHTYAVEVDRSTSPEQVRWYLDGKEYHRVSADQMDPATWDQAVHHGVFLILDVAVGGKLPAAFGGSLSPATEPGHPMRVDYVSVATRP